MKFNSNKLTERIDFCEDISERKWESSKTKVKSFIFMLCMHTRS